MSEGKSFHTCNSDNKAATSNSRKSDGRKKVKKVGPKGRHSSSSDFGTPSQSYTGRHLPYGITQYYLPADTSERAPPNPSHACRPVLDLPTRRDGRLS